MLDPFSRRINYLRVSVTDRCNLRCTYCMPYGGIKLLDHSEVLTYDEISDVVREAVSLGVEKVRLTGGEPLVRKGVMYLVEEIGKINEIKDFSITTNGVLLDKYARELKNAGIKRVNISLDTINPKRFKEITRVGNIEDVFRGIRAAEEAGLLPVKINCVIQDSENEPDAKEVRKYCEENGLEVRFIKQMTLSSGSFSKVIGGEGGHCSSCNRLRLTANGMLKPCLFNDIEYSVREHGAKKALQMAVDNKPRCGSVNHTGRFYNIGG